jgi:hypothetical protein
VNDLGEQAFLSNQKTLPRERRRGKKEKTKTEEMIIGPREKEVEALVTTVRLRQVSGFLFRTLNLIKKVIER